MPSSSTTSSACTAWASTSRTAASFRHTTASRLVRELRLDASLHLPGSCRYAPAAGQCGGNIVFTDSLLPDVKNVRLVLTASHLWDALGLPLTAFNDSRRSGTIRSITERDFQPYQRAVVRLTDRAGAPVISKGKPVEFTGTNPVDFPNCYLCHGGRGRAAAAARAQGLTLFDKEYAYWKKTYPDMTDFMARQLQASINVLELHDKRNGTAFLKGYDAGASSNRLGATGPVNCADCHGDNVSGNLREPRPGATGYVAVKPGRSPRRSI